MPSILGYAQAMYLWTPSSRKSRPLFVIQKVLPTWNHHSLSLTLQEIHYAGQLGTADADKASHSISHLLSDPKTILHTLCYIQDTDQFKEYNNIAPNDNNHLPPDPTSEGLAPTCWTDISHSLYCHYCSDAPLPLLVHTLVLCNGDMTIRTSSSIPLQQEIQRSDILKSVTGLNNHSNTNPVYHKRLGIPGTLILLHNCSWDYHGRNHTLNPGTSHENPTRLNVVKVPKNAADCTDTHKQDN